MENDYQQQALRTIITILKVVAVIAFVSVIVMSFVKFMLVPGTRQPTDTNKTNPKFNKTFLSPVPTDDLNNGTNITNSTSQSNKQFPDYFSWFDKGLVGAPRDQGSCNICWAITIFQVMQTQYAIKNNKFIKLSYEDLFQKLPGIHDCKPNSHIETIKFMKNNNISLLTEECYPDDAHCTRSVGIQNYNLSLCPSRDEIMHQIYNHGPVIAAVNTATWSALQSSGNALITNERCSACNHNIYPDKVPTQPHCGCCRNAKSTKRRKNEKRIGELFCSPADLNHVVVIIGYNKATKSGDDSYYIVLNSSRNITRDGILKIRMDACGIETSVTGLDIIELS